MWQALASIIAAVVAPVLGAAVQASRRSRLANGSTLALENSKGFFLAPMKAGKPRLVIPNRHRPACLRTVAPLRSHGLLAAARPSVQPCLHNPSRGRQAAAVRATHRRHGSLFVEPVRVRSPRAGAATRGTPRDA